jgi:SpoVK/Ycf46/Vps4 family AAA+-type ATPase
VQLSGLERNLTHSDYWVFHHPEVFCCMVSSYNFCCFSFHHLMKNLFLCILFFNRLSLCCKGPPGCAKTSLAKAAAGSAGIAFISLSPAEVFASSYVGDAEGIIRRAFSLARSVAPCILFFDEIDAILGTAGGGGSINDRMGRESSSEARVLSTFLNEMDGVDSSPLDGVLCLGATNRPTVLDAALLRPGRFDKVIYVPPPDRVARRSLFSLQLAKAKYCCESIDVDYLASDVVSGKLTGAEIIGVCQEALMLAMREVLENDNGGTANAASPLLTKQHLDQTLRGLKPLLTDGILAEYQVFEQRHKI